MHIPSITPCKVSIELMSFAVEMCNDHTSRDMFRPVLSFLYHCHSENSLFLQLHQHHEQTESHYQEQTPFHHPKQDMLVVATCHLCFLSHHPPCHQALVVDPCLLSKLKGPGKCHYHNNLHHGIHSQ